MAFIGIASKAWTAMNPRGSIANMDTKSALVTGASRGIGRGIAIELARAGCRVAVNYVQNAGAAEEALALVRSAGGEGVSIQADSAPAADRRRRRGGARARAVRRRRGIFHPGGHRPGRRPPAPARRNARPFRPD